MTVLPWGMTIHEEAKQIRAEVAAHNPGRGRKYPKALRERPS